MVENLSVKNFRGLGDIKITLAPFTLIGGANNVGKTSVLEAMFLLYGYRSPVVFQQLRAFRNALDLNADVRDLWENIFYNYDTTKPVSISAIRDRNRELLEICRDDGWDISTELTQLPTDLIISTSSVEYSYPLKVFYEYGKKTTQFHFALNNAPTGTGILTQGSKENQANMDTLPVINFSSDKLQNMPQLFDLLGKLNRSKQKPEIVTVMKEIDPRIKDVVLGEQQHIYLEVDGLSEMIPLTSMGAGVSNVLYWTATALSSTVKIMLIDEIENGIHYQCMESIMSKLCDIGARHDCQIIATTHSLDCIRAFASCGETHRKRTAYIRLERNKQTSGIVAKNIEADQLKRMLNSEWEVR
jgi:AAA15 family ATPase/GTPase